MRQLQGRLQALESRIHDLPPIIDDQVILDVLAGIDTPGEVLVAALEKLFCIVRPGLEASLSKGIDALWYCNARGIVRPHPTAPMGALAEIMVHMGTSVPESLANQLEALRNDVRRWLDEIDPSAAMSLSAEQIRAFIFVVLEHERFKKCWLCGATTDGVPTWTREEASRMLRFVQPLEHVPSDLPLLVWSDPDTGLHSSSPRDSRAWTPVDTGLHQPGYLLLAGSDEEDQRLGTVGPENAPPSLLIRRVPAEDTPAMSDEEIVAELSNRLGRPLVGVSPRAIDALFIRIEAYLLASVLVGAEALRVARGLGFMSDWTPLAAMGQAASMVSYESTAAMPNELVEACGWALPNAGRYDVSGGRLTTSLFTIGSVRGALIFRLLEKHGIHNLRNTEAVEIDIPSPPDEELTALMRLIAPLQWDIDPDFPMLVWRDSVGSMRTSSSHRAGQIRTDSDRSSNEGATLQSGGAAADLIPNTHPVDVDYYIPRLPRLEDIVLGLEEEEV